jgi:hypothetical protein
MGVLASGLCSADLAFFWLGQETLRGNMDQEFFFFSSRLFLMGVDGG